MFSIHIASYIQIILLAKTQRVIMLVKCVKFIGYNQVLYKAAVSRAPIHVHNHNQCKRDYWNLVSSYTPSSVIPM